MCNKCFSSVRRLTDHVKYDPILSVLNVHLYDVPALVPWQRRPVQESVVVGVSLGEAEPAGQIWKPLLVAFKHHGIIKNLTYRSGQDTFIKKHAVTFELCFKILSLMLRHTEDLMKRLKFTLENLSV